MTLDFLKLYSWGLVITTNLLIVFYVSTLKIKIFETLCSLIKKKHEVFTLEDFDDYAFRNWGAFGEMLGCPLCFGFWLSLIVSIAIQQYFPLPLYYVVFSALSWPSLSYGILRVYMGK